MNLMIFEFIKFIIKDFLNYFPSEEGMIAFKITSFNYEIFDKILIKQTIVQCCMCLDNMWQK